jgi:hypothetical protein
MAYRQVTRDHDHDTPVKGRLAVAFHDLVLHRLEIEVLQGAERAHACERCSGAARWAGWLYRELLHDVGDAHVLLVLERQKRAIAVQRRQVGVVHAALVKLLVVVVYESLANLCGEGGAAVALRTA